MKNLVTATIIALAAAAALAAPAAEAKSFWKTNIQFQKDGMKFYSKNCINEGSYCGNWNVNG